MKIVGVDDAGRGPVIGPMVIAGILIDEKDESFLFKLGVKDSKEIRPSTRKKIKEVLSSKFLYFVEKTSPMEIDASHNLNYTEAVKAAMVINRFLAGVRENLKVIVDCPSVNIDSWRKELLGLLNESKRVELICDHKADSKYLAVSAASIIAKETREEEIEKIKKEYGVDFGSGYPSDPKTIDFLRKNYNNSKFKNLIRFSWDTVRRMACEDKSRQEKLFD